MSRSRWLALAIVAGALAFYLMIYRPHQTVRQALEAAATRHGLPPEWLVALGETESGLDPSALNQTGADAERGGAWGPTQITEVTARAFGYTGPMAALLSNVDLAAELTASMISDGFAERGGEVFRYGTPASFEDMLAVWNGGRLYSDPALPRSTLADYIPRARAALADLTGAA